MFQIERQAAIVDYLKNHKKSSVDELCIYFGVSKATIRRDITELAADGRIIKTHGGVLYPDYMLQPETPYLQKKDINAPSKQKIGKAAAALLENGDVIAVDSGSTTVEMIRQISVPITLLTHDLNVAMAAAENSNIRTILSGGEIRPGQYALSGCCVTEFYRTHRVMQAFLACDAVDIDSGLWTATPEEACIKQEILRSASTAILLTDHTKFSTATFCAVCRLDAIHCIISDHFSPSVQQSLEEKEIECIKAV